MCCKAGDQTADARDGIAVWQALHQGGLHKGRVGAVYRVGATDGELHAAAYRRGPRQAGKVSAGAARQQLVGAHAHAIDAKAGGVRVAGCAHQFGCYRHAGRVALCIEGHLHLGAQLHIRGGGQCRFALAALRKILRAGAVVGGAVDQHAAKAGDGTQGDAGAAGAHPAAVVEGCVAATAAASDERPAQNGQGKRPGCLHFWFSWGASASASGPVGQSSDQK